MKFFYQENKKLCISTVIGIILTCLLGTLSHFVYEWTNKQFIIGLFVPVNESVWEHMKLTYFPMFVFLALEYFFIFRTIPRLFCAGLSGLLAATGVMPVIFYTYTGILGFHTLFLDILTFVISVIIGFAMRLLSIHRGHKKCTFFYFICVLILGVCFLIFTYYPPSAALFTWQ